MPAKDEPPVEASPSDAAPTDALPKSASRRPGDGERLNPEIAGLGTEVMLAAFPETVGGWTRSASRGHPAGTAGRWADGAFAAYRQGEREIQVDVNDMIRVNACTPGTAEAILEQSVSAERGSERVALGKHPAIRSRSADGATLGLWLGDRCQLGLSGTATPDELVALGSGLDLDALAAACARRDPAGVLLR